jgi:uncharacterized membrane protein YphA (DoxX/SURF4 family)
VFGSPQVVRLFYHVRWFTEHRRFPVQFDRILTPEVMIPVAIAAGIAIGTVLLWRLSGRRSPIPGPIELGMSWENYETLLSWMPLVIGVHTAVTLMVAGIQRWLFVPSIPMAWNFAGGFMALLEIVVALGFLFGALTRPLAAVLAGLWLAGVFVASPLEMLEQTTFLGIAFLIFTTGRGPAAFDMLMERLNRPIKRFMPYAIPVLRIATGFGIMVAAFDEKLLNIPMGLAFLADYRFNFFPAIGIESVSDRLFVIMAGTVELTFGLLLMTGAFTRLVILILWFPFNLTLPFLGWRELVGHLPIYGIMALLLVWGETKPATEDALVEGIRARESDDAPG